RSTGIFADDSAARHEVDARDVRVTLQDTSIGAQRRCALKSPKSASRRGIKTQKPEWNSGFLRPFAGSVRR
ncbi:MAG: hypothetical protein ABI700_18460, partial [Chloroflexota bacterium]